MTDTASNTRPPGRFEDYAAKTVSASLYGMRLATAVSLALFTAFYLQLDSPSWACTSAAIVCQPIVGSSLLKGVFRMIGTAVGAVAAVLLMAAFPQDRAGFLFAMLAWASLCSFVSTLLRNFAAYAAMLAGWTLIIIASTSIPAPEQVFEIAVSRASEICIGIVCATLVIALTDLGSSPRRLSELLSRLIAETADISPMCWQRAELRLGKAKRSGARCLHQPPRSIRLSIRPPVKRLSCCSGDRFSMRQ